MARETSPENGISDYKNISGGEIMLLREYTQAQKEIYMKQNITGPVVAYVLNILECGRWKTICFLSLPMCEL